jgi:hypothetical protein
MIRVAGTQFNNDIADGGRNRQDILKEIYERNSDKEFLVKTEYLKRKDGGEGIRLKDFLTNEVIGWIHSFTADAIVASGKRPEFYIGHVGYHGCYHVKLDDIPARNLQDVLEKCEKEKNAYGGKNMLHRIIKEHDEQSVV